MGREFRHTQRMKHLHRQTRNTSIADGSWRRMAALLAEREAMREEIRQLSAAVQVYADVVRRMESAAPRRAD
jgi:hypothetical protein